MDVVTRTLKIDGVYRYDVSMARDPEQWNGDVPLADTHDLFFVTVEIRCITAQNWALPALVGRASLGSVALAKDDPSADPYANEIVDDLVEEAEEDRRLLREAMCGKAFEALRGCRDALREAAKGARIAGQSGTLFDMHADAATTALAALEADIEYPITYPPQKT